MAAPWTVVLAGEEAQGRRALRGVLRVRPDFRVIGEVDNGPDAVELLDRVRPDLAALAVHMDGLDGFEVLRAIPSGRWPRVLFFGQTSQGVLHALGQHGIDHLTDSPDGALAHAVLDRLAADLVHPDPGLRTRMEHVLAASQRGNFVQRIPVRHGGKVEIVDLDDVDWIGAAGNYVELHCDGRRHLHRSALFALIERLDPERFVRIHRSVVVNVERVRELEPTPQGDYLLRLDGGAQLRLSRRFRKALDRIVPEPPRSSSHLR